MDFYVKNPYYSSAAGEAPKNEIQPAQHKMGCAKGFKPVKWNTQLTTDKCLGNAMAQYGQEETIPRYNTACSINQTPLDPSQAMTKSNDHNGNTFGFYSKPIRDQSDPATALSDLVMRSYNKMVSGQNTSMLWSGQVSVPPNPNTQPGAGWNTYNNVQTQATAALGNQTCSAMGDDGWLGSCDNMRGEGSKTWFMQDDTYALTGLYGIPRGTDEGKGAGDDRPNVYNDNNVAPMIRVGSDGIGKWNVPKCPAGVHCGDTLP
jgi:hypothetical protein